MKKSHLLRCLAAIFVATILAAPAAADNGCDLQLKDLSDVWWRGPTGAGYDVFDSVQRSQHVDFTVVRKKGTCSFFIGFVSSSSSDAIGRALHHGQSKLRYQLYRDNGFSTILRDISQAEPGQVLSGVAVAGRDEYRFEFLFAIPPQQVVGPGPYHDQVELRLYEGTIGAAILRDVKKVHPRVDVPSVAELSFRSTGIFDPRIRSTTLRFDPLRTGATGTVRLWARSNAGYRMFVESQHGGVLRHEDPIDESVVGYTLRIDNAVVPLNQGARQVSAHTGVTTPDGREHVFDVTIGTVDTQSAGEYQDVITVTLRTL